jgi:antitoxin component YwqK of YwqJK toxin-antitoxin module
MERRNFLSGLASLPLFRSIFRLVGADKVFDGLNAPTHVTEREKAGLRGPVKTCVEETSYPTGKSLTTTEYDLDGRLLETRISNPDGSEWVTTKTYDADGRLVKASSGKSGEPATESLYTYDERGRLKEITSAEGKGNRTSYRYEQQGRKTEVKTFAPEVFERNKGMAVAGSMWDAAQAFGVGAPEGGSITTLFDERDLPIELQILDSKERVVKSFIRTYDENGRIREENQIQENPALTFPGELSDNLNDKQLETLKSLFRGKNGTGKSFVYDSQGRVAEVRDRNWGLDELTTTSYNEHGDISEERKTATSNLAFPREAFTIDEDGTVIPDRSEGVSEPPPDLERTTRTIYEYRYEYDQNGNWTERTVVFREVVDGSSESGESSTVYRRTLTYF